MVSEKQILVCVSICIIMHKMIKYYTDTIGKNLLPSRWSAGISFSLSILNLEMEYANVGITTCVISDGMYHYANTALLLVSTKEMVIDNKTS